MLGMLPIVLAGYAVGVSGLLREIAIVLVAALPLVWFICALACIQTRSGFVVLSARSSLLRWPVVGFVCHRSLWLVDAHVRCRTQYVIAAWAWGLVKDPGDSVHPACQPWITESLRFWSCRTRAQLVAPSIIWEALVRCSRPPNIFPQGIGDNQWSALGKLYSLVQKNQSPA
jgi:hypothetical protein